MQIWQLLSDRRVPFETVMHAPAYTAQQRAKHLHVPGAHPAKTVVLALPGEFVVAVLSADRRVDLSAVARTLGQPARLANDAELTDLFRDCEWGAKSPFGTLYGLRTIVDESLPTDAMLVLEAQRHSVAVLLRCRHFQELENPRRFSFAA